MFLEGCFVRCGALIYIVLIPKKFFILVKKFYLCKECEREPGADVSPECGGENQQSRCVRTPGAASPSCAAADATEADPLPDAIAPSLAATPDFARRNTSWCHAIEVGK
jgi:hypothetical protein